MVEINMIKKMEKKGQLTIFILVAILLVSAILIFILWVRPTYLTGATGALGFEGCVGDVVEEEIKTLSANGGFINPEFTYMYMNDEIPYLCYTEEYYQTCTVQVPFLKQRFEEELKKKVRTQIDACYTNSIDSLKSQGYDVEGGKIEYDILFEPRVARVEIDAPTTIGSSRTTRFNAEVQSPIYEIVMIATSILQYESRLGDSDIDGLMFLYPDYTIDKVRRGDGTKIYIIENKLFDIKYQFASKSLPWPAGYAQ